VHAWLKARPGIEVISRDRSGAYARAASEAAPQAEQVADRWHLLKNLREAVERLFERPASAVKGALAMLPPRIRREGTPSSDPAAPAAPAPSFVPTALPRLQQARQAKRAQRVERHRRVRQLHAEGQLIRHIAAMVGLHRDTVRRYLRDERCPAWQSGRPRRTRMDAYRKSIDQRLAEGCHNVAELHRELTGGGHRVSYHAVHRFVRRRLADLGIPRRVDVLQQPRARQPSARQLAFAWIRRHEERDEEEQARLEAVRRTDRDWGAALELADEFAGMARKTWNQPLSAWLDKAEQGAYPELRRFARGLRQDEAAVTAALREPWSNGKVEGHVNRLKVMKRQMYGRAGSQLLRARVRNAA
jgi:transposase